MPENKIKSIAIHLPQFHPIPENDGWWGKGFTEWTNVVKARPLFEEHYQPHLPADLGFYDLRLEESRLAQEKLAKDYGIYGFCYYHYWFTGKKILETPLNRKRQNKKEDLPFMMCWANENWTRVWNGGDKDVLLEQKYSSEDDLNHIHHLFEYFKDDRYIKVDGKPVFIVYRPDLFPDMTATLSLWRNEAQKAGFPDLYLGNALSFEDEQGIFDFSIDFQPKFSERPQPLSYSRMKNYIRAAKNKLGLNDSNSLDLVYDYDDFVDLQISKSFKEKKYPGITPGWDNTARRKEGYFVLHDSTPEKYEKWLDHIVTNYPWNDMPESFLFINAWNEWAEGNHLEPCAKWGLDYLETTNKVLKNN
ncbi:Glycosyltransferase WbsX [Nonlabens sp. Hel1_33_55]|uniref:glycoside hydrolase family 99-like domain-containing protein n=1 Tax=Nonlabens sp. Hel1_33_55 TaxID=1336802 RepID=UPI000875BA2B|nr:glycoside hydrolase family 99-like domain-containing protein [Nonlabens sp. Hel1_33_55]SCX92389.1 Glycosyltransferase WbsX [Nonlabens sp. Hel1_33_55]